MVLIRDCGNLSYIPTLGGTHSSHACAQMHNHTHADSQASTSPHAHTPMCVHKPAHTPAHAQANTGSLRGTDALLLERKEERWSGGCWEEEGETRRAAGQAARAARASISPRDLATGLHCTTWSVVGGPVATCPLGIQELELMSPLCSLLPLCPLSGDTQVRSRAEGWSRTAVWVWGAP